MVWGHVAGVGGMSQRLGAYGRGRGGTCGRDWAHVAGSGASGRVWAHVAGCGGMWQGWGWGHMTRARGTWWGHVTGAGDM